MSSGHGDEPPRGSGASTAPGRPAADTPGRLVVRSSDSGHEGVLGASDTAVAVASSDPEISTMPTPLAGTPALQLSIEGTTL